MAATRPGRLSERLGLKRPDRSRSRLQDFVVITGYSGAGKSTAMQVFEDAGYFCVDNLPPEMIAGLVELFMHEGSKVERAAVVSDVRGGEYFEALQHVLEELDRTGVAHRVLFLQAEEETLLTRYKETRRRHPLSPSGSVAQGIADERALLERLKPHAEEIIDSTGRRSCTLRPKIAGGFLPREPLTRLAVTFQSFGFKHGPPRDAELTFDVRFPPNPHWESALRELTGYDQRVIEYVHRHGELDAFYERLIPLLE